jgi:transcriptional regulator with XRE-family HTH domain
MALKGWIDPDYAGKLRRARQDKGLTQRLVAERVGVSPQFYNDVEHGRRRPDEWTAEQIRQVLGIGYETPREKELRVALERLTRVGGEFSYNMAGPWWDELCGALSEARAALAGRGEGQRAKPPATACARCTGGDAAAKSVVISRRRGLLRRP